MKDNENQVDPLPEPASKHLRDVVVIFNLKHKRVKGSGPGFSVPKEQVIHIEPVIGEPCDDKAQHQFAVTTLRFNKKLTKGTIRLYHREDMGYYSFYSAPVWSRAANGKDYDWELTLTLMKDPGGSPEESFDVPHNVDFKNYPRLDVTTNIHPEDVKQVSIHGICRVYLANA